MIQRGEDLSLGAKSRLIDFGIEPGSQQLERDELLELSVGAMREKHARHAAVSDLVIDLVRADPASAFGDLRFVRFGEHGCRGRGRWRLQESAGSVDPSEQLLDLTSQVGRAGTCRVEHRRAVLGLA